MYTHTYISGGGGGGGGCLDQKMQRQSFLSAKFICNQTHLKQLINVCEIIWKLQACMFDTLSFTRKQLTHLYFWIFSNKAIICIIIIIIIDVIVNTFLDRIIATTMINNNHYYYNDYKLKTKYY